MSKARLEVFPGVWLDARHALFLEDSRTLAVSDLHLGYAWAHRYHGQLMPLQPDGIRERLLALCAESRPSRIAILGDIVHRAVPVDAIKEEFLALLDALRGQCGVSLILGNHDKGLRKLFGSSGEVEFHDSVRAGRFLLLHGNDQSAALPTNGLTIMGHEHPAISLGDGVRSAKFPCFLVAPELIVLPAFSRWAAGSDVRAHAPMSPLAQSARFEKAVAILNGKLLPVPLQTVDTARPEQPA